MLAKDVPEVTFCNGLDNHENSIRWEVCSVSSKWMLLDFWYWFCRCIFLYGNNKHNHCQFGLIPVCSQMLSNCHQLQYIFYAKCIRISSTYSDKKHNFPNLTSVQHGFVGKACIKRMTDLQECLISVTLYGNTGYVSFCRGWRSITRNHSTDLMWDFIT